MNREKIITENGIIAVKRNRSVWKEIQASMGFEPMTTVCDSSARSSLPLIDELQGQMEAWSDRSLHDQLLITREKKKAGFVNYLKNCLEAFEN